jgi:myo-inositol-1-phosphate synthase
MGAMQPIRLAIVGVGNCASALVQGLEYYKTAPRNGGMIPVGLMHERIGGFLPTDIEVVAALDVDARKVGKRVGAAIFSAPNCTTQFATPAPSFGPVVQRGHTFDGLAPHMQDYPPERAFIESEDAPCDVTQLLKNTGAEVLVSYLPVGSQHAAEFYAQACLDAGVAMVNCLPVFIASDPTWADRFTQAGLPIVGDDIKSQVGATIVHRTLMRLCHERGLKIERTYQLNTGGNTDFLNMLDQTRLATKKISKTEAVQSQLEERLAPENVHIGPSDYVPWQKDNKVCFLRIEGRGFGGVPLHMEMRLSVEDSPNSAGVAIDAIRLAKLGLDAGLAGPLLEASVAYDALEAFITRTEQQVNASVDPAATRQTILQD